MKYPVLTFSHPAVVGVAANEDRLTQCSSLALKRRYFTKLRIIDSDCQEWRVKSATKVGTVGRFWGFNIFLNQKIRVQLGLFPLKTLSLDEVKEQLLAQLQKDSAFWDSGGNLSEIQKKITNAASMAALVQTIDQVVNAEY